MPMRKGMSKRRKPSEFKAREGTLHSERENPRAPRFRAGIPPPPPYLNAGEKDSWEKFADVLHNRYKILTKEHFAMFEALVIIYDQVRRLDQEIRDNDVTIEVAKIDKKTGKVVGTALAMHPAWSARRAAGQELRQLCGSFGLSPADMGRVSMLEPETPEKHKPEDEFGSGGRAA